MQIECYLRNCIAVGVVCFFCLQHALAEPVDIVHPGPFNKGDQRTIYPARLLSMALDKSGKLYRVHPGPLYMPGIRSISSVAQNQGLDVVWAMTSPELEEIMLPIRIPIHKGLIGWRVPIISRGRKLPLDLDALKSLTVGQGQHWVDTKILQFNGFNVQGVRNYESLFRLVAAERHDYFLRSVVEVWDEIEMHRTMTIEVNKDILIYYPTAFYFFVNNGRTTLAQDIQRGLEAMIDSGEFDKLFMKHHGELLERANVGERRVFTLENPMLTAETPLKDGRLWFSLKGKENIQKMVDAVEKN